MAFSDPQTVTINAVPITLPRVGLSLTEGRFQKDDGLAGLRVSQQVGRRARRVLRLDHAKIAADPFDSSLNAKYSMSAYLVVDVPLVGYTVAEAKQVVDGLTAYCTASSGARITQLLGGEI